MSELFREVTHCFWHFSGFVIILGILTEFILRGLIRFYRMMSIMVKGWPPAHLDADGDHVEYIKRQSQDGHA